MHPIVEMLEIAVPLYIEKLSEGGGPSKDDYDDLKSITKEIAYKGDILLFGSEKSKKGSVQDVFNKLAFALAVMSFFPGGVSAFGNHWESRE